MKTITCACGGTFKPFHIIGPGVDCKDGGTLTFRDGKCLSHELRVVCDRCNVIAYCELQAAPVRTWALRKNFGTRYRYQRVKDGYPPISKSYFQGTVDLFSFRFARGCNNCSF
jgi:hypothetical protein